MYCWLTCGFQNEQWKTVVMVEHQAMGKEGPLAVAGIKKDERQIDASVVLTVS